MGSWLARLPAKCNSHDGDENTKRVGQEFTSEMCGGFLWTPPARPPCSNSFCRHPWLLAWPCATNLGLSAARPPTLRVCARAVRATRSPRAHGSLPYGQPSAPVGLRIRAYSSPLRGLLPAACSARPTPPSGLMQGQLGRVVSVRHARPAAHTLRAVVRSAAVTCSSAPVQSISQRGRQRLRCSGRCPGNSNLTRTYSNLEVRALHSPALAETHGGFPVTRTY